MNNNCRSTKQNYNSTKVLCEIIEWKWSIGKNDNIRKRG